MSGTRRHSGALWLAGLIVLLPLACTNLRQFRHPELGPQHWEREVRRHGVDPALLVNPLAYDDAMRRTARQVVGPGSNLQKLRGLQRHLFDAEAFPFDYDSRKTLTAIEAFERRSGNCVSFTNLFIAMARSVGLPVQAALLTSGVEAERQGDLIVVNEHIVAAYEHSGGATVFDFNLRSERERVGLFLIDDAWITAIYLNNLGADALLAGDRATATDYLETAVRLAPRFAAALGNLGLVRRQLGDDAGALEAYRAAIQIEPGSPSILNNLAALYQGQGREAEARSALRAAKVRGATPFHLLVRGDLEAADGRWRQALRLYRRAARLGRAMPEPHLATARVELRRQRPQRARRALEQALRIDPGNAEARALLRRLDAP